MHGTMQGTMPGARRLSEKNKEASLDAFEMKGLGKILRVSWTAKKTNEWVLNKAGVTLTFIISDSQRLD